MKKAVSIIFIIGITILFTYLGMTNIKSEKQSESDVIIKSTEEIINVPGICQYPDLPTGCESVAAVMVLQHYGDNINAREFAECWLKCNNNFYLSNNMLYGPDPNKVFVGSPFTENSYGCFASVIVEAINNNSRNCSAVKIDDKDLSQLCKEYIDKDKPLIIWATMSMRESRKGTTWHFEDNSEFTWISGEHCLVLVGYDDDYYFLKDPQSGSTVSYQKNIVEARFTELGSQAVYIYKKTN